MDASNQVFGIDISEASQGADVDFSAAVTKGGGGLPLLRPVEGITYQELSVLARSMRKVSLICPLLGEASCVSAEGHESAQMDNFLKTVENKQFKLGVALDVEVWENGDSRDVSQLLLECVEILESEGLGPIWIYIDESYSDTHLGDCVQLASYPLWVASYKKYPPWMPKLWVKNGKNYSIWQYGTKLIPGFAKAVDADLMTSEMYAQLTQASTDPTATDQTEPGEDSTGQIGTS